MLVPHWAVWAHANTQSSESHCITPNGSLLHQMVITCTIVQWACVCMINMQATKRLGKQLVHILIVWHEVGWIIRAFWSLIRMSH